MTCGSLLEQLLPVLRGRAERFDVDVALVLREPSDVAAAQRVRRSLAGGWDLPQELSRLAHDLGSFSQRSN